MAIVSNPLNWSTNERLFLRLQPRHSSLFRLLKQQRFCFAYLNNHKFSPSFAMDASQAAPLTANLEGQDESSTDEYASQAKLLQEFTNVSTINKAWVFSSSDGASSQAMFSMSQPDLVANKKRTYILSSHISKTSSHEINFHWSPIPIEQVGVSTTVPSPSGSKFLIVRNGEGGSPTKLEIWGPSQLQKEICIPQSVHGPLYTDGWFEGISWNPDETLISYIAEEPQPLKTMFDGLGNINGGKTEKDCGTWKIQGDWEEDWGETYSGKGKPSLYIVHINSGHVQAVEGIPKHLSVGQVVWAPPSLNQTSQYLVFVGWAPEYNSQPSRKLGIRYCYNRPCYLYAVEAPVLKQKGEELRNDTSKVHMIAQGLRSAFLPRFSPDGKALVFLSAKSSVDTGAHCATNSLHKLAWSSNVELLSSVKIVDLVPVIMCPEDGGFPGLYYSTLLHKPWLSDGNSMIMSSVWGSSEVVLSINTTSGEVLRISPNDSRSWNVLAIDGDNVLAVCSSLVDPPQIKYGYPLDLKEHTNGIVSWEWLDISMPFLGYLEKIRSLLSSKSYSILKIPVGAKPPIEAIYVSSDGHQSLESCNEVQRNGQCNPLIVVLHGGPHSTFLTSYSKNLAFLSSMGFNLLLVNYRGSLGFGEEALQSLLGKVGRQDVDDVLAAIDHVFKLGLAESTKIAVLGGSHGGFLTTHLIGQAPDRFCVAAVRNPVCNIALMIGTTDIPDWCYVETYGSAGNSFFTEAPSLEHLSVFYNKSPISHISKVKVPVLFLLGAQDLRVPVSNGIQYARALKEKGVPVKTIVFPNDVHGIDRPQSDFESFLNIGLWFKKYCK
ncbi:acylamino-acid-releasing enzyme 1 isoform X1 [Amborella trichopoda]|uniref:acylaminoacyl-peptidase n=2 Tax=Amborella trichopoda TaxID=13333 RepID=W1P1D4_AMBTC|nr:acylamino-acid-releasing enzyme 1 isoform X1 [Amborella trichopoda]ERN01459.1 hypothetical protein AMTR_s00002p00268330 [Amborella trichopoda]|eukprot:XP_006838890.3 acylamino-acid-releasing enzyme 1 isoform X1 [Amborella trichopoda]